MQWHPKLWAFLTWKREFCAGWDDTFKCWLNLFDKDVVGRKVLKPLFFFLYEIWWLAMCMIFEESAKPCKWKVFLRSCMADAKDGTFLFFILLHIPVEVFNENKMTSKTIIWVYILLFMSSLFFAFFGWNYIICGRKKYGFSREVMCY